MCSKAPLVWRATGAQFLTVWCFVQAVSELAKGRRVVIVDGVGYPAVGSICGVSNAQIAARLSAPVLLVGPKGVGNAVDSHNLNASYFESVRVACAPLCQLQL